MYGLCVERKGERERERERENYGFSRWLMLAGDVEYQEQQEGKGFLVHDVGKSSEWDGKPFYVSRMLPPFCFIWDSLTVKLSHALVESCSKENTLHVTSGHICKERIWHTTRRTRKCWVIYQDIIKTMVLVGVVCGFQTLCCLSPSKSCNWFVEALNPGDFIKEPFITGCSGLASDMPCHGAVWGPLGYGFYYLALPTSSYLPFGFSNPMLL